MSGSFSERFKKTMRAAGRGIHKIKEKGTLHLDLVSAKGKLDERYKALGKACAARILDRGETEISGHEIVLKGILTDIKNYREEVRSLEEQIEQAKEE